MCLGIKNKSACLNRLYERELFDEEEWWPPIYHWTKSARCSESKCNIKTSSIGNIYLQESFLKQVIRGHLRSIYFFIDSLLKIFDFFFFGEISPSSQITTSSSILNSVLSLLLRRVPRRFRVNIEKIDFRRFGVFWVVEWYWSRNGASETVDLIEVIDSSKSTGISEAAVELSKSVG